MSWQGKVLNQVLKRTAKPLMFSTRLTRARMGVSAWMMEAGTRLMPVPATTITPVNSHVRGEWLSPLEGEQTGPVILYMHGGAYIAGSPRTHRPLTAALAQAANARVFALDYRLAPHFGFPAWLEDGVSAYQYLLAQGIPPQQIVLAGDSAGGNLVLVTLLKLREQKLALPAGAICLSPWTDLSCSYHSHHLNARHDVMLNSKALKALGRHHMGNLDPKSPLISPAYAELHGLPPLMIHVGSNEVLLDDARSIRRNAKRAGVSLKYREWPDMPHVFPIFHHYLPEGRKAIEQMADFVRHVAG